MQAKSSREYHVVGGLLQRAIPKREITLGVSPLDTAQCLLNCGTQHTNDDKELEVQNRTQRIIRGVTTRKRGGVEKSNL